MPVQSVFYKTSGLAGGNPNGASGSEDNEHASEINQNLNENVYGSVSNVSSDAIMPDAPPPTMDSNIV